MTTTFTRYGPIIGTLIIVISFHILIYLHHPARFLQSLITPSVVIPMCVLMLIAIIVGYIPAYITGELFLHIFKDKLVNANLCQTIAYGCFTSLLWAPLLLLLSQFAHEWLLTFYIYNLFSYCQLLQFVPLLNGKNQNNSQYF